MIILHLTPRLKIIADSISNCNSIADIGSDHAYLPIYLVKNKKIQKAIATDVKTGPADIAKKRIEQSGLKDSIEVRVGNGLEVLKSNESEILVISGMGGLLIIDIINNGMEVAKSFQKIILQPMRDSYLLRKWLNENFFDIIDIEIVKEDRKFYEIIWLKYDYEMNNKRTVSYIDDILLKKGSKTLLEFVSVKIKKYEEILDKLIKHDTPNAMKRYKQCENILIYYKEAKAWLMQNVER